MVIVLVSIGSICALIALIVYIRKRIKAQREEERRRKERPPAYNPDYSDFALNVDFIPNLNI